MKYYNYLRIAAVGCLTLCLGCADEADVASFETTLDLTVGVASDPLTKGFIESATFQDGETIGLFFEANAGGDYDGVTYDNLAYTSGTTGGSQTWSGGPVYLSASVGKAFCYWPYISAGVADYTAVPVSAADQTDYLYSGWITNVSNSNPRLEVLMKHAQTAIQLNVKRGSYTGTANLTAVSLTSDALGASGKLNLSTGGFSDVVAGAINSGALDIDLTYDPSSVALMALPLGSTAHPVHATLTIDGRNYSIDCPVTEAFQPGYRYAYSIVLNGVGLVVSPVTVTPWVTSDVPDGELDPSLQPDVNP